MSFSNELFPKWYTISKALVSCIDFKFDGLMQIHEQLHTRNIPEIKIQHQKLEINQIMTT